MVWLFAPLVILGIAYLLLMSPWSQLLGRYPFRGKTTNKVIALTFDDGPNEPYTSELLTFLKKEDIRGTFFLVGNCAQRHPGVAKKIVEAGHVVGNHSLRHSFATYFQPGKFAAELRASQDIIFEQTGKKPALLRTPWLWRHPLLLRAASALGLQPVGGEFCHSREVFGASAETIAKGALAKVKPGAILIFHDGKEGSGGNRANTIEAVKMVVKELKQRGYRFETADTLLGITPYQH